MCVFFFFFYVDVFVVGTVTRLFKKGFYGLSGDFS